MYLSPLPFPPTSLYLSPPSIHFFISSFPNHNLIRNHIWDPSDNTLLAILDEASHCQDLCFSSSLLLNTHRSSIQHWDLNTVSIVSTLSSPTSMLPSSYTFLLIFFSISCIFRVSLRLLPSLLLVSHTFFPSLSLSTLLPLSTPLPLSTRPPLSLSLFALLSFYFRRI